LRRRSRYLVRDVLTGDLAERVGQAAQAMELADPDAGASPIDRWINRVAEVIGVAMLAMIVLLVFGNAVGRYLAGAPIIWAEELVIAVIPWLAMSGVFLSIRRRQVIRLDYFVAGVPKYMRTAINVFVSVVSAAAFTGLAFYSFQFLSLFGGDTTVYLRLPTGWFKAAMLIGSIAAAVAFLVGLIQEFRRRD
jgi:TRAP-type C4-dicarboxylate transport system permease small subunit